MRSVSDQFVISMPTLLALLLLLLCGVPAHLLHISLVPNVVWIVTLVAAAFYPASWPLGIAFVLGLLQDVIYGTPLGAQALLTVLLVVLVRLQAQRQQYQQFRVRWLEAAGTLMGLHALLWLELDMVQLTPPPFKSLMVQGLISAVWYPIFYWVLTRLLGLLPQPKVRH